jgi:adenylylsulfate kinase
MKRVLICGLPGSGKSFLASRLVEQLGNAVWLNADQIREQHNDWDFTPAGRLRQMNRIKTMSLEFVNQGKYAVCDFVCPTTALRSEFNADIVVWMDTIKSGRFADTNKIFERLDTTETDVIITTDQWWDQHLTQYWVDEIVRLVND